MKTLNKYLVLAAALAACTVTGSAVSVGQNLGIINGVPTGDANETALVNAMVGIHNSVFTNPQTVGSQTVYAFSVSTVDATLPAAVFGFKIESNDNLPGDELAGVLGAGYQYALAKYGGGQPRGFSYVYYLGGGAGLNFTDAISGYALSHLTFFNPSVNRVPDGGATAILLGASVLGLAAFRRKS